MLNKLIYLLPLAGLAFSLSANSLTEKLDARRAKAAQSKNTEFRDRTNRAFQEISDTHIIEKAKQVGDKAPLFSLPDSTGNSIQLTELLKKGPVVLVFYRGEWCPYCNLTLNAYQEHLAQFDELNATLVAISPENPDNALTLIEKNDLSFPVLTDQNNDYARELGIVFEMPADLRDAYLNNGFQLIKKTGTENTYELPLSATYVIDASGIIQFAFLDVNYTKRADPLAVLEVLKKQK